MNQEQEFKKELLRLLQESHETEVLEFKHAENDFSFEKLGKYFSALSNEANLKNKQNAWLVFGVNNKKEIVGTNYCDDLKVLNNLKYGISRETTNNIGFMDIGIVNDEKGRIIMFKIPPAPQGIPINFKGHYYGRENDSLCPLNIEKIERIRNQTINDWSAQICKDAAIDDLDENAIKILKEEWIKKSKNKELEKISQFEILEKLLLIRKGKITNACLLLVGKEDSVIRLIPNSQIFLEWRLDEEKTEYDTRDIIRKPYMLADKDIWLFVDSRNTRVPFKQGFFELDIWSYDQDSIREAALNAFAHREYRNRTEPTYIRVSPNKITVKSAGGFVSGVTKENILDAEGKWRNPFLMDILNRIGLVERAGLGLDRIYKTTILQGKGMPNFDGTNNDDVVLNIPAKVKDINFVYYLENIAKRKQIIFDHAKDFIELENIRKFGKSCDKKRLKFFLQNNLIEISGKGRGAKYILSKNFYEFVDNRSEYTRKKWLNKDEQKLILLNYLKQHKKGRISDFKQLFIEKELDNKQINRLLKELKEEGVYFEGKERSRKAYWKINEKDTQRTHLEHTS